MIELTIKSAIKLVLFTNNISLTAQSHLFLARIEFGLLIFQTKWTFGYLSLSELQFLRSKCCQLQDELESRGANESKYKGEIQLLSGKLRESMTEFEEKEMELESRENSLQAQVC